eukprot:688263-Rhodomonas_salina.1
MKARRCARSASMSGLAVAAREIASATTSSSWRISRVCAPAAIIFVSEIGIVIVIVIVIGIGMGIVFSVLVMIVTVFVLVIAIAIAQLHPHPSASALQLPQLS